MGSAWTEKEIVHLLGRAAFSASDADIEASLSLGKEATVLRLVNGLPLQAPSQTMASIEHAQLDGQLFGRRHASGRTGILAVPDDT